VLFSRKTLGCAKFFLLTPVLRTSPVREYRLRFAFGGRLRCFDFYAMMFTKTVARWVFLMPRRPISCIFQAGNNQQKRKTLVFQHYVNGNSTFDNHFRGMDPPM